MVKKPSYEELKQRVEELEKEATKRKQSDIALKESEERYRAIVAAFDGLIYACSQDVMGSGRANYLKFCIKSSKYHRFLVLNIPFWMQN